MQLFI